MIGCAEDENVKVTYIGKIKGKKTYEYTIDECQYIRTNYKNLIHKGNCSNPYHPENIRRIILEGDSIYQLKLWGQ